MSFRALQPLFLSTPIAIGGLGFDPPTIGTVMSVYGTLNGVFTIFFFSRLTRDGLFRREIMGVCDRHLFVSLHQ